MNGFIRHSVLGTGLGAALTILTGCVPHYRELVDPCYPERYNYQARQSVRETFNNQAANGHKLDQTVWNQHFEVGTDKLAKGGEEHLRYLARRQPVADPHVFVQTSYDAKGERKALDDQRVAAVKSYLENLTVTKSGNLTFDVTVHDVSEPGLRARPAPSLYVTPASALTLQPTGTGSGTGYSGSTSQQPNQQPPGTTQSGGTRQN